MHGAFAWGVLDRLLEDGRLSIEGVSATSAGAMNAAVLVTVPEAESLVAPLRERFDASTALGVPAHITVLFPFMPPTTSHRPCSPMRKRR